MAGKIDIPKIMKRQGRAIKQLRTSMSAEGVAFTEGFLDAFIDVPYAETERAFLANARAAYRAKHPSKEMKGMEK